MKLVRFKPSYRYVLKQKDFTGDGEAVFWGFFCWFFVVFLFECFVFFLN